MKLPLPSHPLHRRIAVLLLTLIALNLIYPISELGPLWQLLYIVPYVLQIGIGVSLLETTRPRRLAAFFLAGVTLISAILWMATREDIAVSLLFYGSLSIYQSLLVVVLLRYIFARRHVQLDVIMASAAAYLLIADVYLAFYMTLDIVTQLTIGQGAFLISASPGAVVRWQDMIYYSLITITNVGLGDITPTTSPAQALTSSEAVIGVLYNTILVARLISLYSIHSRGQNEPES
jgi:hypothetical protein